VKRGAFRAGCSEDAPPVDVVVAADVVVHNEQLHRNTLFRGMFMLVFRRPERIVEEVGALWGQQIVREFRWTWMSIEKEGEVEWAVVSTDRAYAAFPRPYLSRMLLPPYADNTLMLMFNMLKAGKLPPSSPNAYEDLTDGRLVQIVRP
jgi:hypothetical protein